jgi:hypothetical protein
MDVVMEVATAATAITVESAGTIIFEPLERNEKRKWRRRSEAPAGPSDLRSRMERMIRQRAQELTQLNRTIGHLENLVESGTVRKEAQRLTMITWMQEREQKSDARYEDDKLWGADIMKMITKSMKGVGQGQEGRERHRERTARTDGGGLEAFLHADTTREEGAEDRQQPQQQPKPKTELQLKLQPNTQPPPKPQSAPTPATRWETVPLRAESQSAQVGPDPGPGPAPMAR